MAIDYSSLLTGEQKKQILEQRIAQYAAEGYQHEINKQIAQSLGNEEGVASSDAALALLEASFKVHQQELAALPKE